MNVPRRVSVSLAALLLMGSSCANTPAVTAQLDDRHLRATENPPHAAVSVQAGGTVVGLPDCLALEMVSWRRSKPAFIDMVLSVLENASPPGDLVGRKEALGVCVFLADSPTPGGPASSPSGERPDTGGQERPCGYEATAVDAGRIRKEHEEAMRRLLASVGYNALCACVDARSGNGGVAPYDALGLFQGRSAFHPGS